MECKKKFENFVNRIGNAFRAFPTAALLCVIGGILLIAFPERALSLLIRLFGIILLLYGVLCVLTVPSVRGTSKDVMRVCALIGSILLIVIGLILIISPGEALGFLTVVTGLYLIFDGAIKLYRLLMAASFASSAYGISTGSKAEKIALIILCLCTIGAGIWLLFRPGQAMKATAILIGVALLIDGAQSIYTYFVIRRKKNLRERRKGNFCTNDFVDKSK